MSSSEVVNELEKFRHQLLQSMGLLAKLKDIIKEADLIASISNLEKFGKESRSKEIVATTKVALDVLKPLESLDVDAIQKSLFEITKILTDLASQASGDTETIGSTKMNIEQLIALADKLDKAGRHAEVDLIDKFIQTAGETGMGPEVLSEELNLPEHQPHLHEMEMEQEQAAPPKENIPGAREKSSVLPQMLEKFLKDPTMSLREDFLKSLDDYMKFSKEEDVVASGKNIFNKMAEDEFIDSKKDTDALNHHTKELMWHDESSGQMEEKVVDAFAKAIEEAKHSVETAHAQGISALGPEMQNAIKALFVLSKAMEEQKHREREANGSHAVVFEKLASIADQLDSVGAIDEASMIDEFIAKHADKVKDDPYDSKRHHNLQVREPKRDKERVDREGRKDHHVHTYQQTNTSSLSTRYCPEHIGVSLGRIGDNTYQCPLDGQVYNWETGWTDYDGKEHPGGSVAGQTPDSSGYATPHRVFDSRENILNTVN